MRTLFALITAFAGVASGAAYVCSNGPARPAVALVAGGTRGRAAHRPHAAAGGAQAGHVLRPCISHAVLKVREATGTALLKCPLRRDVPGQYLRFATAGIACGVRGAGRRRSGDVLGVRGASGRVAPLCPARTNTPPSSSSCTTRSSCPRCTSTAAGPEGAPASVWSRWSTPARREGRELRGEQGRRARCSTAAWSAPGAGRRLLPGRMFHARRRGDEPRPYQALAQGCAPSAAAAACGPVPMSVHP